MIERSTLFLEQAQQAKTAVNTGEYQITCQDGSVKTCEIYAQAIPDHLVLINHDITARVQAEEERARLEALRVRTERIAKLGSWEWTIATDQVIWSEEMYRILGIDPAQGPLIYAEKHRAFPAKANERLEQAITRAIRDGEPYALELEVVRRDGTTRPVLARGFPTRDAEGRVVALHGFMQDITERKQAERQQRLAASVFAHSLNGVVIADPQMRILDANRSYCELTGFNKAELLGQPLARLVAGDDDRSLPDALRVDLDAQGHGQTEIDARRKDGAPFPAMLSLSCVRDADGEVQNHIASVADISALKAHAAELERLAHHDALTGLPNRRLLLDRLAQAIALADRTGGSLAVCYLDLDGFKPINDRHGHEVGDQYLIAVGGMLQANLRRHDSVARIGGPLCQDSCRVC